MRSNIYTKCDRKFDISISDIFTREIEGGRIILISMKGHAQSYNSSKVVSNGSKWSIFVYGLIVILAFGATIFGGMLLHKLKHIQHLNHLLSYKDHRLISLQLHLQKERDYRKGKKQEAEEMKAKIYSLKTQKMELKSKIMNMQSTIASLKEELQTMESTVEEKQNEIKMFQKNITDLSNENQQQKNQFKFLKQGEAAPKDSKLRSSLPVNVWSVSTDDPANPTVNLTDKVTSEDGEMYSNSTRETSRQPEESIEDNEELESTKGDRYQDSEVKIPTEHQENKKDNARNDIDESEDKNESNGTSSLSKGYRQKEDLQVNTIGGYRKKDVEDVVEQEYRDTDLKKLNDSKVKETREASSIVSKNSNSMFE